MTMPTRQSIRALFQRKCWFSIVDSSLKWGILFYFAKIHYFATFSTSFFFVMYRGDVVKAELYFGAFKSVRRKENLALLDELGNGFSSLPFEGNAARCFGQIRAELAKAGTPIGPYDLQIAAIALHHGLTLVTHNTREFSRVANLNLEDWEA